MIRLPLRSAPIDSVVRRHPVPGIGLLAGLVLGMAAPAAAGVPTVSAKLLQNSLAFSVSGQDKFAPFDQGGSNIDVSRGNDRASGLTFEALSEFTETSILFKNSIIGSGAGTRLKATIGVEITIDNTFGFDFKPVLKTKLLAAGMGTFLKAAVLENYAPGSGVAEAASVLDCTAAQLKNCAPVTDARIATLFDKPGDIFGKTSTGFDFNVTVDGDSKYRMQASLGYDRNGNAFADVDQASVLSNFRRSDTDDQIFTTAYAWDDTFVDITLGDLLKAGDTLTAVYTITTFIDIADPSGGFFRFFPIDGGGQTLMMAPGAFAAFGDPIGGQGPIVDDLMRAPEAFRSGFGEFSLASLAEAESGPLRINTNGTGVFDLPYFIVDPVSGQPVTIFDANTILPPPDEFPYGRPDGVGQVPEPSVWAMLIIGFGGIGAAMRRRATLAKAARAA